jgi:hypothetical protein
MSTVKKVDEQNVERKTPNGTKRRMEKTANEKIRQIFITFVKSEIAFLK